MATAGGRRPDPTAAEVDRVAGAWVLFAGLLAFYISLFVLFALGLAAEKEVVVGLQLLPALPAALVVMGFDRVISGSAKIWLERQNKEGKGKT